MILTQNPDPATRGGMVTVCVVPDDQTEWPVPCIVTFTDSNGEESGFGWMATLATPCRTFKVPADALSAVVTGPFPDFPIVLQG